VTTKAGELHLGVIDDLGMLSNTLLTAWRRRR